MTNHRTPMRAPARVAATIVTVALMWLPGVAHADTPPSGPGTYSATLPLLGSNLLVEITTDGAGTVTSVTVDGQAVDFEQDDDEVTFTYNDQTVTIEFANTDDQGEEADDDQGQEADDDSGDEAETDDQGDFGDDDQGDQADDDQGDQADDDSSDEFDGDHSGSQGSDDSNDDETDHQGEDD